LLHRATQKYMHLCGAYVRFDPTNQAGLGYIVCINYWSSN
jgi:hypothetical protein